MEQGFNLLSLNYFQQTLWPVHKKRTQTKARSHKKLHWIIRLRSSKNLLLNED